MKRKVVSIIVGIIVAIALVVGIIIVVQPHTFSLSAEYYNNPSDELQLIDLDELKNLIAEKKSFALFVYQPGCRISENFEKIVTDYGKKHNITFLKTAFSELKKSNLVEGLKYYPSMILYRNGAVVTFLHADSDEDVKIYQNPEDFAAWWQKYITEQ